VGASNLIMTGANKNDRNRIVRSRSNSRLAHAAHWCLPLIFAQYVPIYINWPISMEILLESSFRVFADSLNCLNCQPSLQCTSVPSLPLSLPSLHSLRLKVWESRPNVKYIFESESTAPVKGCGDDKTIGCFEGKGRSSWDNTELCIKKLGSKECYCFGSFRYFAIANGDDYPVFQLCCHEVSGTADSYYCG
jgi:hypothetical protein